MLKTIPGMTEGEILGVIGVIAKRFSKKFCFGYHDSEDIKQQATLYALEVLERYDTSKGDLENFLAVHVRNRLLNLKRDTYFRLAPPCISCPFFQSSLPSQCRAFSEREDCELYASWWKKTENRKSLMTPAALTSTETNTEDTVHDVFAHKELLSFIDRKLEVSLRSDFKRILEGLSVAQHRKNKVREAVAALLEEFNVQ